MVTIPKRLAARLASEPHVGRDWLAALPATASRLAETWNLQLGSPVEPGGMTSIVFPAQRTGPRPRQVCDQDVAMLKIPVPDAEVAAEAAGLALVDGDGAVRLIDHDPASGALLLEAADPDRSLLELADADHAAAIAADLLHRWWRPVPRLDAGLDGPGSDAVPAVPGQGTGLDTPPPHTGPDTPGGDAGTGPPPPEAGKAASLTEPSTIPRLADAGPVLAAELRRRQFELDGALDVALRDASRDASHGRSRQVEALLDRAVATFAAPDPTAETLLHTDLHQGNVLAAKREPWLIIDPKPLVGEAAYDLEPLLRDHRGGWPSDAAIRRRFDATSAQLGLDRDRARDWVVARSVELGLWSLEVGDETLGSQQLRVAAVLVSSPGRGR